MLHLFRGGTRIRANERKRQAAPSIPERNLMQSAAQDGKDYCKVAAKAT